MKKVLECKLIGQDEPFKHIFISGEEVHGYIIGMTDAINRLGYIIEHISVNGKILMSYNGYNG